MDIQSVWKTPVERVISALENRVQGQKNSRCAGKRIFFDSFPQKSQTIHSRKNAGFLCLKVFRRGAGEYPDQPRLISFMISLMVASRMGSVDSSVSTALMFE